MTGNNKNAVAHFFLSALLLAATAALPAAAWALTPAEDTDADNMLDTWELANGLNPNDPTDADVDNDNDGVPNKGEYHLGSDPNDGASLPPLTALLTESFEGGTIPAPWFTPTSSSATFTPENITAWDGSWSLVSDPISYPDEADIVLPVYVVASELEFRFYVNSNSGDYLRLYVDDELVYSAFSAPRSWRPSPEIVLDAGYHEIRFTYDENSPTAYGCMCLRIDDIRIEDIDSDLDGMTNDFENANGLDPNDPSDAALDGDVDGLTNLEEFQNDTDPNDSDSDNDTTE